MPARKRKLKLVAIVALVICAGSVRTLAAQQSDASQPVQTVPVAPAELQQLVAPFALYPDALVAQILAASTYPTQVVEAERWLQSHSNLSSEDMAKEADKQSWDPSVKALIPFPSVLERMDRNLSWTSAVGDAYFNQEQDVLDAVQVLRKRAEDAGTLQSTPQQSVATQGSTIVIEPADPDICYLPVYDPWTVYGVPLAVYPGFFFDPWVGPPFFFGPGIGLRYYRGYRWGWPAWGFNWGRRQVLFNHDIYVSHSPSFFHRFPGRDHFHGFGGGSFPGGGHDGRGPDGDHNGGDQHHGHGFDGRDHNDGDQHHGHGFDGRNPGRGGGDDSHNGHPDRGGSGPFAMPGDNHNHHDNRGFDRSSPGTRSGAFSGFGHGGAERDSASRGQSSLGRGGFGGGRGGFGGGGMRGGGGGMRSGGGGGGGRHR